MDRRRRPFTIQGRCQQLIFEHGSVTTAAKKTRIALNVFRLLLTGENTKINAQIMRKLRLNPTPYFYREEE